MHEMDEIPEKFSDPLFRRLFILSEIGNFTGEELKQYEESMKDMSDYYNIIDTAAEEAEKRGVAKGIELGREEAARNLKALGSTSKPSSRPPVWKQASLKRCKTFFVSWGILRSAQDDKWCSG